MHRINEDEYMWAKEEEYEWQRKKRNDWAPNKWWWGKEEVDYEHVSLLCSTEEGSPSVSLWYVLWTALRSGHWPDERRYISNHFIHSFIHSFVCGRKSTASSPSKKQTVSGHVLINGILYRRSYRQLLKASNSDSTLTLKPTVNRNRAIVVKSKTIFLNINKQM